MCVCECTRVCTRVCVQDSYRLLDSKAHLELEESVSVGFSFVNHLTRRMSKDERLSGHVSRLQVKLHPPMSSTNYYVTFKERITHKSHLNADELWIRMINIVFVNLMHSNLTKIICGSMKNRKDLCHCWRLTSSPKPKLCTLR